jgi:L-alanine-DL-glutamate epimerase-like enolase superfamily enzyme
MISIRSIDVFVFRVPLKQAIRSAVGRYNSRPGVFLRIEDHNGTCGWGEVFCNFPPCGAEHRARLIETMLKPLLLERASFSTPQAAYRYLVKKTDIIAIKSGEFGPFAQTIAGIDIALWDIWAKKQSLPLWRLLNPHGSPHIHAYASGLGPQHPEKTAEVKQAEGYRAFKLKVGFDPAFDEKNLLALRERLGPEPRVMVDANQVWDRDQAISRAAAFEKYDLHWIEEPIRCDRPLREWRALAAASRIPLAAGENLRSKDRFQGLIDSGTNLR